MAKPTLVESLRSLENELVETLIEGHHQWRPDLAYPQSHSDMQGAVRELLRRYKVEKRDVAILLEYAK